MNAESPKAAPTKDRLASARQKFIEERDRRMANRPEGSKQFVSEFTGELTRYEMDPWTREVEPREPLHESVDILIIGGGFAGLMTSAHLRQLGIYSIRILERAGDVGGTWYWNRYPGVACDVASYDYFPLLDEMGYVPRKRFSSGPEIYEYCQAIARRFNLYKDAVFQTTATATVWSDETERWNVETDRGDSFEARFVICANGYLSKPKLPKIEGMASFEGKSFHTSRWDYEYTGADLQHLSNTTVGIIGTGATAVQIIPNLATAAKELYVFQRTPSSIELRENWDTDPEWAASLKPGWQAQRIEREYSRPPFGIIEIEERPGMTAEERERMEDEAKIAYMLRIHEQIDEIVNDKKTADALKPWYPYLCKRPCWHNDYLNSFNRPNVHLVDTAPTGVMEIGPKGPRFGGRDYEVDLLIYATGFEAFSTGIYNHIVGRGGLDLQQKYADGVRTFFGIHTHGFPNLFIMGGIQASFDFNNVMVLREQGNHITACIDLMRKNGWDVIDVKADREEWWVDQVVTHRSPLVNNPDCTPGWFNSHGDATHPGDTNYGGGFRKYIELMAETRLALSRHFETRPTPSPVGT